MTLDTQFFINTMLIITIVDLIALPLMLLLTVVKNKIVKKIKVKKETN